MSVYYETSSRFSWAQHLDWGHDLISEHSSTESSPISQTTTLLAAAVLPTRDYITTSGAKMHVKWTVEQHLPGGGHLLIAFSTAFTKRIMNDLEELALAG